MTISGVDIGILTAGKPTLGMVLCNLLLVQDVPGIRIFIVDTGASPAIERDDVLFALRLASDRGIPCHYEYCRERERAFSVGRLRLVERMTSPHICLMDDDIAVPSLTLKSLLELAQQRQLYGYIAPHCKNALTHALSGDDPHFSPGSLICQDGIVRQILLEYYSSTVDVLDKSQTLPKMWEVAFLTRLFAELGRLCVMQPESVVYHLDYREHPNWALLADELVRASAAKARELAARFAPRLVAHGASSIINPQGG